MKWFIILACFVAAQFAHEAHVQLVHANIDSKYLELELGLEDKVVNKCIVTTNKGENIILKLDEPETSLNLTLKLYTYSGYYIIIDDPTAELNGIWIVTIEEITHKFYIQVKDMIYIDGLETIRIHQGQYATFRFPSNFSNLEICMLKDENEFYDILSKENSELSIKESNKCGVQFHYNKTSSEGWSLYASDINSNNIYKMKIYLQLVTGYEINDPKTEYLLLGKKNKIIFPKRKDSQITYCQLEHPNGMKLPIQDGSCSYEIPFVTKYHQGLWKVNYGVVGSTASMETFINITTYEQLSTSVHYSDNSINLLCQVRGQWSTYYEKGVNYCLFTRPDNLTFSITSGIGNEKYQYYGDGERETRTEENPNSPKTYDCGITIKSPSTIDYGSWKCTTYIKDDKVGTILNVYNFKDPVNKEQSSLKQNIVHVRKGNPFTLMCSAEEALDYCWLLSPNGTIYSVSKNGSSPSDLTYKGSGLEFGECGAVVEVADNTHQGEWSCRMGVFHKTEMTTRITVTVTDSLLIADEKTIDITYKNPTILNCNLLAGYEINYCRWIRPDGLGISNNVDNKYVTERTLSSCKLTITEIDFKFDIGSWYCAAGISGEEMKEASTVIQIRYSYMGLGGIVSVILAIALLVITTITLFVIIVRKRRNRQLNEKVFPYKS